MLDLKAAVPSYLRSNGQYLTDENPTIVHCSRRHNHTNLCLLFVHVLASRFHRTTPPRPEVHRFPLASETIPSTSFALVIDVHSVWVLGANEGCRSSAGVILEGITDNSFLTTIFEAKGRGLSCLHAEAIRGRRRNHAMDNSR